MPVNYDAPSIRPGAAPILTISAVGFAAVGASQPVWLRMTEALVNWIRYHFADATRIEYANLVNRVWTDSEDSPIMIDSLARWNPKQSDERPAILVDRMDQETDMNNLPIGPQYQGIKPGYFGDFMIGHHVVHCLGGREGEAEILAAEVWRELKRHREIARQYLCLYKFLPEKIMRRKQLADEYKEHFAVSIPVLYSYQESWKVTVLDETPVTQIQTIFGGA